MADGEDLFVFTPEETAEYPGIGDIDALAEDVGKAMNDFEFED